MVTTYTPCISGAAYGALALENLANYAAPGIITSFDPVSFDVNVDTTDSAYSSLSVVTVITMHKLTLAMAEDGVTVMS